MRFARVGTAGAERPVLVAPDGAAFDLTSLTADIDGSFLARLDEVRHLIADADLPRVDLTDLRFGSGDLIDSGTPEGVGLGMAPPTYLKNGDVIELSIGGLGGHRTLVSIVGSTHDRRDQRV